MYEIIRSRKQYIYNKDIPHSPYLCVIYENTIWFMKGVNQKLLNEK